MSLSGVQITIRSTAGVAAEAAGGRGDRVVGLELDHRPERRCPSASIARSAIGNWASRSRGMPGARLVARVEVVAERLDDLVRRAADVRRALLAQQVQQLVDEPGDAGQSATPSRAEDRRPGRVVGAEQLVGGVDEVDSHGQRRLSAWAAGRTAVAGGPATSLPRLAPAARIASSRPLAVAWFEVDGRDAVRQDERRRTRAARRRARSP